MKAIADTGFVVAFQNRNDRYHAWAVDLAGGVTEPLLTCESVLSEAAFHLGSSEAVLALVEDGLLRLAFDCSRHLRSLRDLAERYQDRRPDFADLCIIRMSEIHPHYPVITIDTADFRVYRRNKREMINIISPPA
jgi:predicted nucleic acid-binding protein